MLPKWHILIGFVASYILVYFFHFSLFSGLVVFLSSFLIDFDHYLYYVYKKKSISYVGARKFYEELDKKCQFLSPQQKASYKFPIMVFHGIEFWIILALLGFISLIFLWILIGVAVHMAADWEEIISEKLPFYLKLSQVAVYVSNKEKENEKEQS